MRGWLLAWSVMAALGAVEDQPVTGRLCVDGDCRDSRCGDSVAPAPGHHVFTFTSSSGDKYYLGLVRPEASAICEDDGTLELKVSPSKAKPSTPTCHRLHRSRTPRAAQDPGSTCLHSN